MATIYGGNVTPGAQRRVRTPIDKLGHPQAGAGFYIAKAHYDFAVNGGLVSTIALMIVTAPTAPLISVGSRILGGFLDVTTLLTAGGGGTGALQVEAANDLVSATAVGGAPWSTTGMKNVVPRLNDATTWLKTTTAARDISFVIATAAVTAGVFDAYIFYLPAVDP